MTWDLFTESINSSKITLESATFKLILSLIAGGLVGLNREQRNQPAGFRTHILISVGATLLMIVSIYIPQNYLDFKNGDPGRIAAQVVSGIGFLGAGAIIRLGTSVKGLTTAASIWLISAVGLCIGAGLYGIAFLTVLLTLFTLIILEKVENKWLRDSKLKTICIVFGQCNFPEHELNDILEKAHMRIRDYTLNVQYQKQSTELKIVTKFPRNIDINKLIKEVNKLSDVQSIKII